MGEEGKAWVCDALVKFKNKPNQKASTVQVTWCFISSQRVCLKISGHFNSNLKHE